MAWPPKRGHLPRKPPEKRPPPAPLSTRYVIHLPRPPSSGFHHSWHATPTSRYIDIVYLYIYRCVHVKQVDGCTARNAFKNTYYTIIVVLYSAQKKILTITKNLNIRWKFDMILLWHKKTSFVIVILRWYFYFFPVHPCELYFAYIRLVFLLCSALLRNGNISRQLQFDFIFVLHPDFPFPFFFFFSIPVRDWIVVARICCCWFVELAPLYKHNS